MKKKLNIATVVVIAVIIIVAVIIVIKRLPGKSDGMPSDIMQGMPQGMMPMQSMGGSDSKVNVEVKQITYENFSKTTNINGELEASDSSVSISSDVGGTVKKLFVSKGDTVTKGMKIAVIDPSTPGSTYKERTITSSFDGVVTSVDVYEGQKINQNACIAELSDPESLILTLDVPEKYLSTVKEGTKATFTTAAYPDTTYSATVSYMAKSVSTATRTVETELTIDNQDSKLLAGMFVKTRVITEYKEGVFTVPTTALSSYLGDTTVYIVRDNKAVRTVVETGSSNDTLTVITSGLSEGDLVIVGGSATDGSAVNVIN